MAEEKLELRTEVIISDGGSHDNSFEVIESFQKVSLLEIDVIKNETGFGPIANKINGFAYAMGQYPESEFLISLDDDVTLDSSYLTEILKRTTVVSDRVGMITSNQFFPQTANPRVHSSTGHFVTRNGAT